MRKYANIAWPFACGGGFVRLGERREGAFNLNNLYEVYRLAGDQRISFACKDAAISVSFEDEDGQAFRLELKVTWVDCFSASTVLKGMTEKDGREYGFELVLGANSAIKLKPLKPLEDP